MSVWSVHFGLIISFPFPPTICHLPKKHRYLCQVIASLWSCVMVQTQTILQLYLLIQVLAFKKVLVIFQSSSLTGQNVNPDTLIPGLSTSTFDAHHATKGTAITQRLGLIWSVTFCEKL